MIPIYLYIDLEPYLAQWFIHEQGGREPVKLSRGSVESAVLENFLQPMPENALPQTKKPGQIAIEIPEFKTKPPYKYHYLPPRARFLLVTTIRNRFDLSMWTTLHKFSSVFHRQDNLIYAFMEKHDIELTETNWNAIAKRYQRKRNYYLAYERRKKMLGKNSDFKE